MRDTTLHTPVRTRVALRLALAASAALFACSDDSTGPGMAEVAGTYVATEFTSTVEGTPTDELADGAAIELQLNLDGSTEGSLFLPDAGEGGSDVDADLLGTWTLRDGVVELEHATDTFLRDTPLSVQGDELVGDRMFEDVRIQLTLAKQ